MKLLTEKLISTGDVSVSAGQWEMFNMAMKGWLLHQSRSPHCSIFCLLQALCWSAWWRAWRGPRCPPVTRYGHSHTPSHSHSLLGGCHVDKLHRLGPRDPRPGLRGVSDSVPGDEDDLYLSLSIIPRVKARAGCEGWTWTDGSSEDFPLYCWMFSHLSGLAPYSHCLRKENKSSTAY